MVHYAHDAHDGAGGCGGSGGGDGGDAAGGDSWNAKERQKAKVKIVNAQMEHINMQILRTKKSEQSRRNSLRVAWKRKVLSKRLKNENKQ